MSLLTNPSAVLYKRLLLTYVKPYRGKLVLGGFSMLLVAAAAGGQAYIFEPLIDEVFVKHNAMMLYVVAGLLVFLGILNGLGDYGQSLSLKYVGQRVVSDMQADLFEHLMRSDITLFHDQSSGRLISRMTNDIILMRMSVSQVITGLIKELSSMAVLIGLMFWQSALMSCIAFVILVFAILPVTRLGRRMRKISDATQNQLGDFTSQLDDTFQGVRMVKAYAREDYESQRARESIRQLFKLYFRGARAQSLASPILNVLGGIALAIIVLYGGSRGLRNEMTGGEFTSFIGAMIMAYRPVKNVASINSQLQEGMAAAARFFSIIDTKPQITDREGASELAVTKGQITFEHVSFHYAASGGGVTGLDFTVPAGKTVALVGASGSGKTTIMNLLLRFYDVQAGRISIDGADIRDVSIRSLRNSLALVSQDIVLFNDTVRANILYGKLDATDDAIIDAAKKANAHEFIMSLPQGYETQVGPAGVKLSGGQRQRISIARAILKNAPILLLDEATSALDTASERAVQEALNSLMQHRTTLVIAHRLTTIQDADLILVLDGGKIQAQGTHRSLLEDSETYRHMHQLYHQQDKA